MLVSQQSQKLALCLAAQGAQYEPWSTGGLALQERLGPFQHPNTVRKSGVRVCGFALYCWVQFLDQPSFRYFKRLPLNSIAMSPSLQFLGRSGRGHHRDPRTKFCSLVGRDSIRLNVKQLGDSLRELLFASVQCRIILVPFGTISHRAQHDML